MKIIISYPEKLNNEAQLINNLFEGEMDCFHLRKPNYSEKEYQNLLAQIAPKFLTKVVLHNFYHLSEKYNVKGIHGKNENCISCSTHSVDEFNALSKNYEYAFLSPVFDSISKINYKAQTFDLSKRTNFNTKLIALGGINEHNKQQAIDMGFDGIAMLGNIWQNGQLNLEYFNAQKIICTTTDL
ncbi:MAG: thiamine phosphate synthase [Bacteroidetes bacterium]|nr:thiamine phosphate synthase [Bacteroidota bacterium]